MGLLSSTYPQQHCETTKKKISKDRQNRLLEINIPFRLLANAPSLNPVQQIAIGTSCGLVYRLGGQGSCGIVFVRMLVYEYIDNGNLEQWLHGDVGLVSPLTWEIRMNIILGTAKGYDNLDLRLDEFVIVCVFDSKRILLCSLAYLHEGLEPKVVDRDVKSSNILLDRQWNAKVSDFGLAKLLFSERSYVTTRVMGTYGYVAPEYACTGMLNEKSDIYSFGILIMEIISGRNPVDHFMDSLFDA
ncbi:hypothetical protein Syun_001594 [Stephania yunnanensis]|uniref:non-specific serine/threonine protein kinase n=1 Tax=Stephania yunnanensis TaxID=152371 RepID=A0AAP0LI51_9MAGN